ncbi:MAG: alpha/beta fold hydrolase [Bacteroidota bacterium]
MQQEITFRDQATITIDWFKTEAPSEQVILCLPAMGVRASYYHSFAQTLQAQGITTVTADWRGQGTSSLRASRRVDFGYETLVEDLHELIGEIRSNLRPTQNLLIVGHSLGGQIASLCSAKYPKDLDSLVLLTACLVYYKGWPGWEGQVVRLAGHLFHPLSRVVGYFPGNVIGFGGREARTVMYDWCYNLLYGSYRLAKSDFDYEAGLQRAELPVLAISLHGDRYAPQQAVENLRQKFTQTAVSEHLHIKLGEAHLGKNPHFSWVKNPEEILPEVIKWSKQNRKSH